MEAIIAGLAAPVTALFQYNRGNFMYDRGQDLTKKFQAYTFKVNQFGLYREDVRDLVALTLDKTSNYQIVVALELGFIIALIGPARLKAGTPSWITWLTFASLCESVIYLTLGLWFASHASISAASYGARLLTQFVRLPVPSDQQLTTAVTRADDFEGADVRRMLRMPFLKSAFKKILSRGDQEETPEEVKEIVTAEEHEQLLVPLLTHIRLLRKLQQYWLNFDAYSRISLAVGTYSMLKALSFYALGYYVHEMKNFYAGLVGVVIFTSLAVLLMTLDMMLSRAETTLAAVLFSLPTVLATIAMGIQYGVDTNAAGKPTWRDTTVDILIPFIHAGAAIFMLWLLKMAKPQMRDDGSVMPEHFRLIHFLDMFKNFRGDHTAKAIEALCHEEKQDLDPTLAKTQAEEALLGAMDEWKGTKSTFCVLRLLMLALELAEAADLPGDHALVWRAKLHVEELKIIDALRKEKLILQMLQSPGLYRLLPQATQQAIERLYGSLTNMAGIVTEVSPIADGFNTNDAWFHVEDGVHMEYYISLAEPHRREPHAARGAVIVSLKMIRDDILLLQKRQGEIEKRHRDLQEPSLQSQLSGVQRSKRKKTRWYREEPEPLVVEDPAPAFEDKYSVGYMLNELGSAFAPKSRAAGNNIDDERMTASLFPWRMFRTGTFITVAVWVLMGIVRCIAVDPDLFRALFFVEYSPPPGRRLAHLDLQILPPIKQILFDPSTLACSHGSPVVGNFYMAYDADAVQCAHEHQDITYVEHRLMALSINGTWLTPCTGLGGYSVDIAVRRLDANMKFAVGIRKTGNDVLLFQRGTTGFRAISALSKEPATAVSITESHVYALVNSTILAWSLTDSRMQPTTLVAFDTSKNIVGFCVTDKAIQDEIFLLERQCEDDVIQRTHIQRLRI